MKISFVQSGGFSGLLRGCELDTAVLAADTAQELEYLTEASGISTSGVFFLGIGSRSSAVRHHDRQWKLGGICYL